MREPAASIDLVEELRMRRWARLHHVEPEARRDDWHPVILEEMSLRDAELSEATCVVGGSRYAPLAQGRRDVHAAHAPSMPRFLAVAGTRSELHYT